MPKFLVLYRSSVSATEMMANATPETAASGMQAWMAWAERCGSALVDMGAPLGDGRNVEPGSTSVVAGGPTGYSILEADSLEAATALLDGHPHLMMPGGGASIEVLEALALPGM